MAKPKPAKLRFYVDADTLGLAHLLTAVRSDVTYPGDPGGTLDSRERPPCDIAPATPDHEWIPIVAERGLVVITCDRRIGQRTAEKAAVHDTGVGLAETRFRGAAWIMLFTAGDLEDAGIGLWDTGTAPHYDVIHDIAGALESSAPGVPLAIASIAELASPVMT